MQKTFMFPKTECHLEKLLRDQWFCFIAKIHDLFQRETTHFFQKKEVKALMLPVTTGSISSPLGLGSDSEPVMVNMFGRDIYLADSMQFLLELGVRLRPDARGVWYIMPSFRGESSDERHLSEFVHLEAEIRGDLDDVMQLVNSLISALSHALLIELADEIKQIAGTTEHLENVATSMNPPKMKYYEAVALIENNPSLVEMHPAGFPVITALGEKKIMEELGGPVWLTNYPLLHTPFYQKNDDTDKEKTALCADLLMGIGETVGAGCRHITSMDVDNALKLRRVSPESYRWYTDMKNISPIQTSGFGMGLERFIAWICQIEDIRCMQIAIRQRDFFSNP